ncbi:hypothetical protein Tco_0642828 [Tanacetum coccineum]
MITNEMKLTENYRMYDAVFGVDVPTTQSESIESTQGTHRTTSAPRTPNPTMDKGESSALRISTVIRLLEEHLIAEEIEKLVEGAENAENDKSPGVVGEVQQVNINEEEEESVEDDFELKRREQGKHVKESRRTQSPITIRSHRIHSTLISSDTEKLQELTITDPPPSSSTPSSSSPKFKLYPTNRLLSLFKPKTGRFKRYKSFFDELQGCYGYLFEHLKTRFMPRKKFNGLIMERQQSQADVAKMIEDAIQQECENLRAEISSQINNAITNHIPSQVDSSVRNYMSGHILHFQQDDLPIWLALKYKFERIHVSDTPCRPSAVRLRDQDDPHDTAHHEGENDAKSESGPSTSGNQEQLDDFDFCTDSYATYDDELSTKKVSQELMNEMSQTVDEAKLQIIARRANGSIVSITESDYKNLKKNDIEDMYLLIVNSKLGVESYQQKVNLTAPIITFPGIKKYKVFSIVFETVYGIIYKNNKKEKRVTRHQEIHKFCDATLKRVLEGLKSYNNNVKHGYVTPSLSKDDAEYLQLFELSGFTESSQNTSNLTLTGHFWRRSQKGGNEGAPKAMGTGRGSKVADRGSKVSGRGSKVTDRGSPRKWITSDMVTDRASKAGRQVFNPKPVFEFNPIIGHVVPVKDKESDVVKDKESFVVKDKDRVLDDVVKDKESDVVKNVVKDVVSDVVLEQVVSNIKLSNVVSKKKTRRTELPKLNAPVVADKHGVDVVSDNVADKTGVHQRFSDEVYGGSSEVYGGPGEVVGFLTIVVVIPVI